jgi:hypothetical protein
MPPQPPADPTPAQERAELYQAIGEATTAWARVEDHLGTLFTYFVAGTAIHGAGALAATAAFHAVINFNSKLAMTHCAAQWAIFGPFLKPWQTLQNKLRRKAKLRNDIVHFSLIRSGSFPGGSMRYYLSPSLQDVTVHLSGKDPPRLNVVDIRQRAQSFRQLAKELQDFAVLIGVPQKELPPEFRELLSERHPDSTDKE